MHQISSNTICITPFTWQQPEVVLQLSAIHSEAKQLRTQRHACGLSLGNRSENCKRCMAMSDQIWPSLFPKSMMFKYSWQKTRIKNEKTYDRSWTSLPFKITTLLTSWAIAFRKESGQSSPWWCTATDRKRSCHHGAAGDTSDFPIYTILTGTTWCDLQKTKMILKAENLWTKISL